MRVMMTVWLTPGSVYSARAAAAAAQKELTPGVTSYSMPSASSLSICSRIAPYIDGSPVCSRTVSTPLSSASRNFSTTSSSVIEALSYIAQPGFASASSSLLTSEPA